MITVVCLALNQITIAQTAHGNSEKTATIKIAGSAEKEITPNEIFIAITIQERMEGKNKLTIDNQEKDLVNGLVKLGIEGNRLKLTGSQSNYIRTGWTRKNVMATAQYELKVTTADEAGYVFKLLDSLYIDQAYVKRLSHSKMKTFKKELDFEAMKNSKERAQNMLNAIDQKLGKAITVNETSSITSERHTMELYDIQYDSVRFSQNQSRYSRKSAELDFKKLKLVSHVQVVYEILP
jgi:uncharacterized protein YggE